jgi:hypothetical protein
MCLILNGNKMALNPIEIIEDEYTGSYAGASDVIESFLARFETLTGGQRNTILGVLQRKNIDTVKKLQAYIEKAGPDIVARPKPAKKEQKPLAVQITSKNVRDLLSRFPQNHRTIRMLSELSPTRQAKALKRAGIRMSNQMDLSDAHLMNRLSNAICTVITGLSEGKGRRRYEISTPTGAGRHQ